MYFDMENSKFNNYKDVKENAAAALSLMDKLDKSREKVKNFNVDFTASITNK